MAQRGPLADLLRAWRERATPDGDTWGYASTAPRRAKGLRREEVAMAAGVSVDYLVQLEQGRADRPSAAVVAALATALEISDTERGQLYAAAGLPVPSPRLVPTDIPPSVNRILRRLPDVAIGVYSMHWTLLKANGPWFALLGDPGAERNLIYQQFTGDEGCVERSPERAAAFHRALVSDLRQTSIKYPNDPTVVDLIARLHRESPAFTAMWDEGTLVEHHGELKDFRHPVVGRMSLHCDTFSAMGTDLRIVTYTAEPHSVDEQRFARLRHAGVDPAVLIVSPPMRTEDPATVLG